MAEGFDSLTESVRHTLDEIDLNTIRIELLGFQEVFDSLKADYDDADRGLILDSPTLNRIKADKYSTPFSEASDIASKDEAIVRDVLRESEGRVWPLQ